MRIVYIFICSVCISLCACSGDNNQETNKESDKGWTPANSQETSVEESLNPDESKNSEETTTTPDAIIDKSNEITKYNEKVFKFEGFTFEEKPVDIEGKITGFEFREFKIYSTSSKPVEIKINAAHTSIQLILLKEKEELAHDATQWKGVLEPGKKHILKIFHDVDAAMSKVETPYILEFR